MRSGGIMKINTKPFDILKNRWESDNVNIEAWSEIIKLAEAVNAMMPEEERKLDAMFCPICKGYADVESISDENRKHRVLCNKCNEGGFYICCFGDSRNEAIIKWNHRE